jgi:hypothetical protein
MVMGRPMVVMMVSVVGGPSVPVGRPGVPVG